MCIRDRSHRPQLPGSSQEAPRKLPGSCQVASRWPPELQSAVHACMYACGRAWVRVCVRARARVTAR
eukprot:11193768-Lingulodinium_polyedra.AAC.1